MTWHTEVTRVGIGPTSGQGDLMYIPAITVLAVLLLVLPLWPWSRGWTWAPAGMVGMIAGIVLLVTAVEVFGT